VILTKNYMDVCMRHDKLHSHLNIKPVTDEQVFYDKFLCDKFYFPSAHVYMQHTLYDKFSYDKFYLLV
jgi:hypothetical protein